MEDLLNGKVMEINPNEWKIRKTTAKYIYVFEKDNCVHTGFVLYRRGHKHPIRRYFVYRTPVFQLMDETMSEADLSRILTEENLTFEDNEFL